MESLEVSLRLQGRPAGGRLRRPSSASGEHAALTHKASVDTVMPWAARESSVANQGGGRRVERRIGLLRLIPPASRAQRPAATTVLSPPATSSATLLASHEAISHGLPERPCGRSHWPLPSVSSSCSSGSWCSPSHPTPDPAGLLP